MGIEFDEIQKGRRRDWDKLRDPEERRREEREKREADPEYQKRKTALRKRDEARAVGREADLEEWARLKKQLAIGGAIVVAMIVVWTGIRMTISWMVRESRQEAIVRLAQQVDSGVAHVACKTPAEAWASWRSAWMRRDAAALYRIYSVRQRQAALSRGSEKRFLDSMQQRMSAGAMDKYVAIAEQFSSPEIIHYPGSPSDGELAVFKSRFVDPRLPEGRNEQVWVLALSWDAMLKEWHFEDLRTESTWRDRWKKVTQIPVRRDIVEE